MLGFEGSFGWLLLSSWCLSMFFDFASVSLCKTCVADLAEAFLTKPRKFFVCVSYKGAKKGYFAFAWK